MTKKGTTAPLRVALYIRVSSQEQAIKSCNPAIFSKMLPQTARRSLAEIA